MEEYQYILFYVFPIIRDDAGTRFDLRATKLRVDERYHSFLNLEHYASEKEIVMDLVDGILTKYANIYRFLSDDDGLREKTRKYMIKCSALCFHFGASSILSGDERIEYGLYPLCFVRDGEGCAVMEALHERDMNNDIVDDETVRMAEDRTLCVYDDKLHQKEDTSDADKYDINDAKICYFTWPAIIRMSKNNRYLHGNVPKQYMTKIWVQLNDELYHQIYGNTELNE